MRLSNIPVVVLDFLVQKIHQEAAQVVLEGFNSRVGCVKPRLTSGQCSFCSGDPCLTVLFAYPGSGILHFAASLMQIVARLLKSRKQFVALVLKPINAATDVVENLAVGIIDFCSARWSEVVDVKTPVGIGRVLASQQLVARMDHVAGNRGNPARRRYRRSRSRLEQCHYKRFQKFGKPDHFMILAQAPRRLLLRSAVLAYAMDMG